MKGNRNALSKKRQDAKELIGILDKIPEERKGEVLGIVKGFALCAENEVESRSNPAQTGTSSDSTGR